MELGKNILKICKEKGITISKLSKMSGVKQPTLHGWTTGRGIKKLDDLKKVCSALETGIHELVFGNCDPYEKKVPLFEKEISGDLRITICHIKKRWTDE